MTLRLGLVLAALLFACSPEADSTLAQTPAAQKRTPAAAKLESAVFAGGCFWCSEADFEKLPGVVGAVSGYTGGRTRQPSYQQVSAGGTGHYEAVRVVYDPRQVSYAALLRHYFRSVDPLDPGGQFCDRGESYRTAIFVATPAQRKAAEAEKARVAQALKKPIATPILAAAPFWRAEAYHQDYYKKHSLKYRFYRSRCGRDSRLKQVWGG